MNYIRCNSRIRNRLSEGSCILSSQIRIEYCNPIVSFYRYIYSLEGIYYTTVTCQLLNHGNELYIVFFAILWQR